MPSIQETGWKLRDQLLNLGLLRPGIDCATTIYEEALEAPPPRFPVAGYVFKINPTEQERAAEYARKALYDNGAPIERSHSLWGQVIDAELRALGYL